MKVDALFCSWRRAVSVSVLLLGSAACLGQAIPAATPPINETNAPHVALVQGPNLSVSYDTEHDSSVGWSNVLTPALTYRVNPHLFFDAMVPVYLTANTLVSNANGTTTTKHGTDLLGDMQLAGHFEAVAQRLSYQGSGTLALATGNYTYGLTANKTTYNVTNHFEYSFGWLTPELEFGVGNDSALANPTVRKGYVAAGQMANFRAGGTIELPANLTLDVAAYEDLPIAKETVYGTVTRRKRNGKPTTTETLDGAGNAEDNGIAMELDVPVGSHFVVNGVYEYSIIQALNTTTFGVSWTLRAPRRDQ